MKRVVLFAAAVLMLSSLIVAKPAAPTREISFADRLKAQEAIERVYYTHQIEATKPFEEAVPAALIERKVSTYLKQSVALERYWGTPVTEAALEREVQRMRRTSRMPDRLQELFVALDGDPVKIRECLARPTLAARLVRNFYASDVRFHGAARADAEAMRLRLRRDANPAIDRTYTPSLVDLTLEGAASEEGPASDDSEPRGKPRRQPVSSEELTGWRSSFAGKPGGIGEVREEPGEFTIPVLIEDRSDGLTVAIYSVPKKTVESWWKEVEGSFDPVALPIVRSSPAVSSESASTASCNPAGTWDGVSLSGAPAGRQNQTAVWTGSVIIVWGGRDNSTPYANTGGQYDPSTDTWNPTSTTGAPSARTEHSSVWTGSRMIVWGGTDSQFRPTDSGGRYDPISDSWTPTSLGDAPIARGGHHAVWTGNLMIVWNGGTSPITGGGRYDLSLNEWTPVSVNSAPSAGYDDTAVWTGNRMIIWGGFHQVYVNSGGRYDPIADTWAPTSTSGAPTPRNRHTAVWSGSRMIVWGGDGAGGEFNTGGLYDPDADSWQPTSLVNAPQGRARHTVVWTGSRMIVWGGLHWPSYVNTGGSYDPSTDSWNSISASGAPVGRTDHTAVWTGSQMIVWGGWQEIPGGCPPAIFLGTGGRYNPATDSWLPTSISPAGRTAHTAIWSGTPGLAGMIVWGGYYDNLYSNPPFCSPWGSFFPAAARYDPDSNTWTAISTTSEPGSRALHTAISTENYMLVWGGYGPGANVNPTRPSLPLKDGGRFVLIADYDADGDGFSVCDGDCNDGDSAVHPGTLEICNGFDDDCNGQVDDGFPDLDADGISACLGDCSDSNPSIHPGATELCNGIDENCDGVVDEGFDQDADGFKTCTGDCNDSNPAVHPGATEVCNGIDDNCDAGVDDVDTDSDGSTICVDCNDIDPAVHPGATELCNGVDDNCSGVTDEGFDQDGDSYKTCTGDCNDADPSVHPFATELCNGVDDNCSGVTDEGFDQDGDGFTSCAGDCDNGNPTVYPGAVELCDGLDNNCNGVMDDDLDLDGDGFTACLGDCNDADPGVWDYPVELFDLSVDASAPTLVSWFDLGPLIGPALTYDLVSGSVGPGSGIVFTGATCLQSGSGSPSYSDTRPNPPVGIGAWYLARGRNSCSIGTFGFSSAGVERTVPSCP